MRPSKRQLAPQRADTNKLSPFFQQQKKDAAPPEHPAQTIDIHTLDAGGAHAGPGGHGPLGPSEDLAGVGRRRSDLDTAAGHGKVADRIGALGCAARSRQILSSMLTTLNCREDDSVFFSQLVHDHRMLTNSVLEHLARRVEEGSHLLPLLAKRLGLGSRKM